MKKATKTFTLEGEGKSSYMKQLDHALDTLAINLKEQRNPEQHETLRIFGDEHGWEWKRIQTQRNTYETLSQLVQDAREQYQWFDWMVFPDNPLKNKGYFEKIEINNETGLPWQFGFMELYRLRKKADELAAKLPSYEDGVKKLNELLVTDYTSIEKVPEKAQAIHKDAMKKNFFEHLAKSQLIVWNQTEHSVKPTAKKVVSLGGETLWNLTIPTYLLSSGMFHLYVIDAWQDVLKPEITEDEEGNIELSEQLKRALKFGEKNTAWYILSSIDNKFESLHPVHVSRVLIGPFENKYLTSPDDIEVLPVTGELLKENQDIGLLRASIQYTYAPNHTSVEGKTRQEYYREDWRDEIIVCPGEYSAKVSESVLGTQVRIFES